jgi:uncharacterized protein YjbI with pentapeptide repeats
VFSSINLTQTTFIKSKLPSVTYLKHNLQKTHFIDCIFPNTVFSECDLNQAEFTGCDLTKVNFDKCILNNINFCDSNITGLNFHDLSITSANFRKAKALGCNFSCANLSKSSFIGADLQKSNFENAKLCGCNFCGAETRTDYGEPKKTQFIIQNYAELSGHRVDKICSERVDYPDQKEVPVELDVFLADCAKLSEINLHGADLTDAHIHHDQLQNISSMDSVKLPEKFSTYHKHRSTSYYSSMFKNLGMLKDSTLDNDLPWTEKWNNVFSKNPFINDSTSSIFSKENDLYDFIGFKHDNYETPSTDQLKAIIEVLKQDIQNKKKDDT